MSERSLDAAYFAAIYAASDDPWSFETSAYEAEKYDTTIAALGDRRFARTLEIGCSIGVLTARLAERSDALIAIDVDERALGFARARCASHTGARFERRSFPAETVCGRFDLIVVSEVAYYWSDADLALARARLAEQGAGGLVEIVHFTPIVPDYIRGGDAVHEAFLADPHFERIDGTRRERYRLDLLRVR